MTLTIGRPETSTTTTLMFLHSLLEDYHPRDFAFRLWDGTTWGAETGQPTRWTMVLKHPAALRRMLLPPSELALGEAYLYDDFDIEGDITGIFALGDYVLGLKPSVTERLRYGLQLLALPSAPRSSDNGHGARQRGALHSRERDRDAVMHHYDVSNEFYALWLDQRMVYTCAYFRTPTDTLDMAQEQKLDYICRKLRLRPGERLLDIGCGWGGLIMYAAKHYGVEALGISVSPAQIELANQRIQQAGLADTCRAELCDYRDVNKPGYFDKLVSIGMFEQVGGEMLPVYFRQAWRLLRPGGIFLNHGISQPVTVPATRGPSFNHKYIFPDGELVSISTTLRAAEAAGFEVRDLESLREHYPLTLLHWLRRLEAAQDAARRATNELRYRAYRLYLAYSVYGFTINRTNLYQALLVKPDNGASHLPLRRDDWYS